MKKTVNTEGESLSFEGNKRRESSLVQRSSHKDLPFATVLDLLYWHPSIERFSWDGRHPHFVNMSAGMNDISWPAGGLNGEWDFKGNSQWNYSCEFW
jgi:hypothetical protein